ncbi:MAG: hypothetical protein D6679_11885 [Candidatus Hydrogenedentota bacterium]|nr:MAG: hypothetical protein D6679_11885 [Candidatus Hydrogenedentota bacterium]
MSAERSRRRGEPRGAARNRWRFSLAVTLVLLATLAADSRVGLVTLPRRDEVQLTIYNSADITLVRERRTLTLSEGTNRLEFSWAGTLIDPTSVQFLPLTHRDDVSVRDISFPPGAPNSLVWILHSEVSGPVKVEISYFTSGLNWGSDYEAVLDPKAAAMDLNSYVRVENHSGETYEDAQVRLVVGTIHLVEKIADLARRGGRAIPPKVQAKFRNAVQRTAGIEFLAEAEKAVPPAAPEIIKEGLSEYFLYTVSGKHKVEDGWSVRWPNISVRDIPVENFYRDRGGGIERRGIEGPAGHPVRRYLKLKNDEEHKLGSEPLPDGTVHVYQRRQDGSRLFLGSSHSKYIPVDQDWEIEVGEDPDVLVKDVEKDKQVENVVFNSRGRPNGYDVHQLREISITNSRPFPIQIEIFRDFSGDFTLEGVSPAEKYDLDTVRFRRRIAAFGAERISFGVITRKGVRARR